MRALNLPRYKKDGLFFGGCINYFTVKYEQMLGRKQKIRKP